MPVRRDRHRDIEVGEVNAGPVDVDADAHRRAVERESRAWVRRGHEVDRAAPVPNETPAGGHLDSTLAGDVVGGRGGLRDHQVPGVVHREHGPRDVRHLARQRIHGVCERLEVRRRRIASGGAPRDEVADLDARPASARARVGVRGAVHVHGDRRTAPVVREVDRGLTFWKHDDLPVGCRVHRGLHVEQRRGRRPEVVLHVNHLIGRHAVVGADVDRFVAVVIDEEAGVTNGRRADPRRRCRLKPKRLGRRRCEVHRDRVRNLRVGDRTLEVRKVEDAFEAGLDGQLVQLRCRNCVRRDLARAHGVRSDLRRCHRVGGDFGSPDSVGGDLRRTDRVRGNLGCGHPIGRDLSCGHRAGVNRPRRPAAADGDVALVAVRERPAAAARRVVRDRLVVAAEAHRRGRSARRHDEALDLHAEGRRPIRAVRPRRQRHHGFGLLAGVVRARRDRRLAVRPRIERHVDGVALVYVQVERREADRVVLVESVVRGRALLGDQAGHAVHLAAVEVEPLVGGRGGGRDGGEKQRGEQ